MPTEAPDRRRRRLRAASCLLIACTAALLYADTLHSPFVLDDVRNISNNPAIRWQELSLENLRRAAFESPTGRVVANWSFGLSYWSELGMAGYRAPNVALHALNGVLVYAFALALYRRATALRAAPSRFSDDGTRHAAALFAALLFVVHPLQTQSVSYLVQRMNALAACFCLLALLCFMRGRESGDRTPRLAWWGAAVASWLLGVGSKENAIVLPFALWLTEWYFYRDLSRRWLRRSVGWLALGIAALAALLLLHPEGLRLYDGRGYSLSERLLTQLRVVWIYVGLVLFPHPGRLNLIYDLPLSRSLLAPITTLLGAVGLIGAITVAAKTASRWRIASFAIGWFLIQLSLESSLIPLAMVYEHRTYLPLVGVALAVPLLPFSLWEARRAALVCALAVVVLGVATHARNQVWRDGVVLWSDVVAKSPGSARARDELGLVLAGAERFDEAALHYREAIRLDPPKPEPYLHLGYALVQLGSREEGMQLMRTALGMAPDDAAAHHALGIALLAGGQLDEATLHLERAVALEPTRAHLHNSWGMALEQHGRLPDARQHYEQALRLDPYFARALVNLGALTLDEGARAEAVRLFARALEIAPESAAARNNLAWVLATSADPEIRDPARAITLAEVQRDASDDPDSSALDTLAAAYAAAGRFDEAVGTAERAASLADAAGDTALAARIRTRLSRFREGQPHFE